MDTTIEQTLNKLLLAHYNGRHSLMGILRLAYEFGYSSAQGIYEADS